MVEEDRPKVITSNPDRPLLGHYVETSDRNKGCWSSRRKIRRSIVCGVVPRCESKVIGSDFDYATNGRWRADSVDETRKIAPIGSRDAAHSER